MESELKPTFFINQKQIVSNMLDIDLIDACLFDLLQDISFSLFKDEEYFHFHWKDVLKYMPISGITTRQGVYKRLKKLVNCHLIRPHADNGIGNKTMRFKFGKSYPILKKDFCANQHIYIDSFSNVTNNNLKHSDSDLYLMIDEFSHTLKIGKSTNVQKRLRQLDSLSPNVIRLLFVIKGMGSIEKELHFKFKAFHEKGEWFVYSEKIIEHFETLKKQYGN